MADIMSQVSVRKLIANDSKVPWDPVPSRNRVSIDFGAGICRACWCAEGAVHARGALRPAQLQAPAPILATRLMPGQMTGSPLKRQRKLGVHAEDGGVIASRGSLILEPAFPCTGARARAG